MEILPIVRLAHHFGGAYSADMIFSFLKVPTNRQDFDLQVNELIRSGLIVEQDGYIFDKSQAFLTESILQKRDFSFALFRRYHLFLKLVWFIPWIQFIGLTGSNSFENCDESDDLDLFIVTSPKRIWICNFIVFILKSMIGKRLMINDNFYIESQQLSIRHKSYYSAIQLLQMIPVSVNRFTDNLIDFNPWLASELPNIKLKMNIKDKYVLFNQNKTDRIFFKPFDWLNKILFNLYQRKKRREGLPTSAETIFIREDYAKLHRYQFHTDYDHFFVKENINA